MSLEVVRTESVEKRKGNQKPTISVFLPGVSSVHLEALEVYHRTGRRAQPWQELMLEQVMMLNEDDLWVHSRFGYSLPRRNGKNEVLAMREMWGLTVGEKILHTAHRTTTSTSAWERLMELLDRAGIDYKATRAVGRETVELANGGRVDFRTRSSKGGLGEGFDLLIIDEAQEYTPDQESALKYVVTDADNPQTLFTGTPPTPHSKGTIFTEYRNSVLQGRTRNAGWAEWSVEEETDPEDRTAWYRTNPSLGTVISERAVQDEIGPDAIDFNIQRLGLWLRYNQKSAISANEWEALKLARVPTLVGKLFVGVKYGQDGTNTAVSIAAKTSDDKVFVEVVDCRSVRDGNQWVLDFLQQADVQQVVVDGAGAQMLLANEMKTLKLRPPVLPTVKEIIVANAAFERAIYQQTLVHMGQPSLTEMVTNSDKRPIGANGGFGYRSQLDDLDVALLDSVMLAYWSCAEAKPLARQKVGY